MEATNSLAVRRTAATIATALIVGLVGSTTSASQPGTGPRCVLVGGTVMTNFIAETTTLGSATGDLKGAVSATVVDQTADGDSVVFTVQHSWVTEGGDTVFLKPAHATAKPVAAGLFAIVSYPVKIAGGTGRFAGASGQLENIGEFDATTGRTVFRYHGDVCFSTSSK